MRLAGVLLAASVIGAIGCAGDSGTSPSDGPAGEYTLQTIDRVSLPAMVHRGPGSDPINGRYYAQLTVVVNDGTVDFFGEARFTMTFNLIVTRDGVTRGMGFVATGSYERQGDEVLFHGEDGLEGDFSGTFRKGTISIPIDFVGAGAANRYEFRR